MKLYDCVVAPNPRGLLPLLERDCCLRSIPGGGGAEIKAIPERVRHGTQTLERFFDELEGNLERAKFIAGDEFTMVDITAVCAFDFAGWVEIGILDGNANTMRWYEAVSSRLSAKA